MAKKNKPKLQKISKQIHNRNNTNNIQENKDYQIRFITPPKTTNKTAKKINPHIPLTAQEIIIYAQKNPEFGLEILYLYTYIHEENNDLFDCYKKYISEELLNKYVSIIPSIQQIIKKYNKTTKLAMNNKKIVIKLVESMEDILIKLLIAYKQCVPKTKQFDTFIFKLILQQNATYISI